MEVINRNINIILSFIFFIYSYSFSNKDKNEHEASSLEQVQARNAKTYYGEWKASKFYSPALITSSENYMELSEAKTHLNEMFIFNEDEAVIFNRICKNIKYYESNEKAFEYLYYNYRMVADTITGYGTTGLHPDQIGIATDSITIIEISCAGGINYNLFILNPHEIVIEYKSTFFFLKKI